jgi:HK97 family phage major capsid protein
MENEMHETPLQRYQGAVPPPEVLALLAALGLPLAPMNARRNGMPIGPAIAFDDRGASASGAGVAAPAPDPSSAAILTRLAEQRDASIAAGQAIVDTVAALPEAERRDLTDAELAEVRTHATEADRRIGQIAEIEGLQQRAARAAEQRTRFAGVVDAHTMTAEETYRPNGEHSYFRDQLSARQGDSEAWERLRRNNEAGAERERRDGTTGATSMGSFIPPVWLVSELAALARVGRVLAPFMRDGGFPTTNSITIPRITTGSTAAGQAGDNAAVAEQDIVTAQLARSTVTIAGQQDISQQSVDLSPFPVDRIVFADLNGAYQTELDRQILRGSGTNELLGLNQVASINTVTYTDASPTAAELYPKFGDAMQQIHSNRFAPAQLVTMHPRRWAWISTAVDSTGRPLGIPAGSAAFNPMATFGDIAAQGIVGYLSNGLPVAATGSHLTNLGAGTEDQVVVFRPDDVILMESPLRTRIHEQTLNGNLTLRFQLFAYVNLFAGRFPKSISTIGGTGLIAPTF